jgi:hypothetical protein
MPEDDFYVGYLPTPPRLKRFVLACVFGILLVAAGIAAVGAARQRDPGEGTWNLDRSDAIDGTLLARPYPMLATPQSLILLVGDGKHVATVVPDLDSRAVRVTGHRIVRGSLNLIEVEKIDPTGGARSAFPAASAATQVTLRGEITDPKCFGGAMKPGDGKPHKACATLCLRGGIPPVFISRNSDGQIDTYVLVDEDDRALAGQTLEAIIPYVADEVQVTGRVRRIGQQAFLAIEPARAVRRL